MSKIIGCFIRSVPLAILIIGIGYLVAFIILNDSQKLDFTLVVLGSFPIIIFLPSVFGQSKSGALHTPKVIFRKVDTLERRKNEETENIFPALSYVLAGVIVWIFGIIIY